MTLKTITDDMLRAALATMYEDHFQGFSTPDSARRSWGPPHYILDVRKPPGEQEVWRGDSHAEMMERIEIERMRDAFAAAFALAGRDETDMVLDMIADGECVSESEK